jgi:hypothetical protein
MRWLFGFGGSTLVSGALGAGCSRCTASEVSAYIASLANSTSSLDIDDDGARQPLTDGLLVLRYLFGFRGDALVSGALSPNCDSCSASSIESHIANQSR